MFQKATKAQSKLRLALFAVSGGGKTFTSLRIAAGLGGRIGLIDTERGSASKYADRFDFLVAELEDYTIDSYLEAIEAAKGNCDVLIIDSLTHAWQELLEEIDRLAKSRFNGNSWAAWSEGTPKQKALVNAILGFPGHVVATMRVKTEWSTTQDGNGKSRPVRNGLSPEQGKGIEYEFDLLMEISADHVGCVIKDRTGRFQDKTIKNPDEKFGRTLAKWLQEGAEPEKSPAESKSVKSGKESGDTPVPKKRGRKPKSASSVASVQNQVVEILNENSGCFTEPHLKWVLEQLGNDPSEEKAKAMLEHVNEVVANKSSDSPKKKAAGSEEVIF